MATSYGRVIRMYDWVYNTPNAGVLADLTTGTEYTFKRSSSEITGSYKWNVKTYDIVTYTADGSTATEVTLYRKHIKGTVYG